MSAMLERGKKMTSAARLAFPKTNGTANAVSIAASANNPVVRLYDRFGFKIVQQTDRAVTLRREI